MQLVEIALLIRHPNNRPIPSILHVPEQTPAILMESPQQPHCEVDAASLFIEALFEHSWRAALLRLGHVRRHEHIAPQRAAKEAPTDPEQVCSHGVRARIESRNVRIYLADYFVLFGEHAAPDDSILALVLLDQRVDFVDDRV